MWGIHTDVLSGDHLALLEGVEVFLDGYWHLLGDAIAKEGVRGHGLT